MSAQGPAADGDASGRTWVLRKTGVTPGCAAGRVGWSRRVRAHPLVAAALAEGGRVSDSMGKAIADYTDRLPAADRDPADAILLGVARAGARPDDIARLAAQMYERSRSGTPGDDGYGGIEDPDGHRVRRTPPAAGRVAAGGGVGWPGRRRTGPGTAPEHGAPGTAAPQAGAPGTAAPPPGTGAGLTEHARAMARRVQPSPRCGVRRDRAGRDPAGRDAAGRGGTASGAGGYFL